MVVTLGAIGSSVRPEKKIALCAATRPAMRIAAHERREIEATSGIQRMQRLGNRDRDPDDAQRLEGQRERASSKDDHVIRAGGNRADEYIEPGIVEP